MASLEPLLYSFGRIRKGNHCDVCCRCSTVANSISERPMAIRSIATTTQTHRSRSSGRIGLSAALASGEGSPGNTRRHGLKSCRQLPCGSSFACSWTLANSISEPSIGVLPITRKTHHTPSSWGLALSVLSLEPMGMDHRKTKPITSTKICSKPRFFFSQGTDPRKLSFCASYRY